jgi:hypothetical protein
MKSAKNKNSNNQKMTLITSQIRKMAQSAVTLMTSIPNTVAESLALRNSVDWLRGRFRDFINVVNRAMALAPLGLSIHLFRGVLLDIGSAVRR